MVVEVVEIIEVVVVTVKVADADIPVQVDALEAAMDLADGDVKTLVKEVVKEHHWSNIGVINIVHKKATDIDIVLFSFKLIM